MDNKKEIILLRERARELNCLYEVDAILSSFDTDLKTLLEKIVNILPAAWRYSEYCKAEIICLNNYVYTENLRRTELKLSANIIIDSEKIGEINVFYIRPVKSEKGIFLPEEQRLLNAVADKIAQYIRLLRLKQIVELQKSVSELKIENTEQKDLFDFLRQFHLKEEEIKLLCNVPVRFKKGETICKQGAITSYFLLLAEGLTKSYLETPNRSFNFMITKPFDFIGLSSLFGNTHFFTTTALQPSLVYLIDKQTVIKLLSVNLAFSFAIMQWYCNSYKQIFQTMNCVANKQALGRVAETLLRLSDMFGGKIIPGYITRKDIASMSAVSTENTIRILSELKQDEIINITTNHIEILNYDLLRTISLAG